MSRNPLLLSPDMPVETVADLMKRYGFEGYPVIEEGKVVGLITRRNVDRALSHKMMANAGILMDAGTVFVTPGDTLDYLQEVMASSGWGQVPVLDPESNEIIGIVTRTDLINTHMLQNKSHAGGDGAAAEQRHPLSASDSAAGDRPPCEHAEHSGLYCRGLCAGFAPQAAQPGF
jgi:tRNA nucleotidyltransferase (CCA-adding enzyme)